MEHEPIRRRKRPFPLGLILLGVAVLGVLIVAAVALGPIARKAREAQRRADDAELIRWGKPGVVGPVSVTLTSAKVEGVLATSPGGREFSSTEPTIVFRLRVTSTDPTRVLTVRPAEEHADLVDDFGNAAGPLSITDEFGNRCHVWGSQRGEYRLRSDQPVGDLIVFPRPAPAATRLVLRLDAGTFGGTGTLKFEVPSDAWRPKG